MSTISALNTFKQLGSVRVVATGNQSGTYFNGPTNNGVGATLTYATGALTIDGVSIKVGDDVLLAGQTSAYQNGIYTCITAGATGVAAVLQRRGDFQSIEQIKTGQYVPVGAGTSYAGTLWVVGENLPAAIGNPTVSGANNINFYNSTSPGNFTYPTTDASANADATTIAVPMSSNGSKVLSFANTLTRYASGNISLANFNLLYTTPIEIIPAPGAGFMNVVTMFGVEWVYGSAAPTSGGALYLQYGNTAHGSNFATPAAGIPAAFFTGLSASSAITALGQINTTTGLATSVCGNAAITVTNATGVFATGTGGSMNWYVWYQIVPIN